MPSVDMIARLKGKLVSLSEASGLVEVGPVCYQVMLPGYGVAALSGKVGTDIVLCTMQYYEGSLGGGNLIPRLVGFLSDSERDFFDVFTTVKGLGVKKGLKALSIPIGEVAAAIEDGDEKRLMMLQGIGKRMAQQIVAELKGKLAGFAIQSTASQAAAGGTGPFKPFQAEALEILIAWGEKRNEAMDLIELACHKHPQVRTAEELVPLVYRVKQGIEV
jgi:Holliday junction DNA helicase RuvA